MKIANDLLLDIISKEKKLLALVQLHISCTAFIAQTSVIKELVSSNS